MPSDVTLALAGIGVWLGLVAMVVGLLGPLFVRNPAYGRTFAILIAIGAVLMVVGFVVLIGGLGFVDRFGFMPRGTG